MDDKIYVKTGMIEQWNKNDVKARVRVPFDWEMNPPSMRSEHLSMHLAQELHGWIIYSLKAAKGAAIFTQTGQYLTVSSFKFRDYGRREGDQLMHIAIYAVICCIWLECNAHI